MGGGDKALRKEYQRKRLESKAYFPFPFIQLGDKVGRITKKTENVPSFPFVLPPQFSYSFQHYSAKPVAKKEFIFSF